MNEKRKQGESMNQPPMDPSQSQYTAADIQVISEVESVRRRPGIYVGATDAVGMHRLLWAVIGHELNGYLAGARDDVVVRLNADGSATVIGRTHQSATPLSEAEGRELERMLQHHLIGYRATGGGRYHSVGDLMDYYLLPVNALSARLIVEMRRAQDRWCRQEYERGVLHLDVEEERQETEGTEMMAMLTFWPDPAIFISQSFDRDLIMERLRVISCLNAGLRIEFADARDATLRAWAFHYPTGVAAYVRHLNANRSVLHDPIAFTTRAGSTQIDVALQYNVSADTTVRAYANNEHTEDGGTHVAGFYRGLARILNRHGRVAGLLSDPLPAHVLRYGLTAVVSVWLLEPQCEGAIRSKLANAEVKEQVEMAVVDALERHAEQAPDDWTRIVQHLQWQQSRTR